MNPYLMAIYVSAGFLVLVSWISITLYGISATKKGLPVFLVLMCAITSFILYVGLIALSEYVKELGIY